MPTSRCTSERDGAAQPRRVIAIAPAAPRGEDSPYTGDCGGAEPFALQVLGDAMSPEFEDGDVIVVEPEGLMHDGAFVIAHWNGEWTFRQLVGADGRWSLAALNAAYPSQPIPDLSPVRGVVIQKSRPGRRRSVKRYVD